MKLQKAVKEEIKELMTHTVKETLEQMMPESVETGYVPVERPPRTAYQKTEQLLFNYMNFKKIVQAKKEEIEEIRKYGVPRCAPGFEFVPHTNVPKGIVLPEESVEAAVHSVAKSVEGTVRVIKLIDDAMATLKNDPYYSILEMRYFEGRTQEDIAYYLRCSQKTISQNKSRLVRALAMRLFPDQVVNEIMN